MEAAEALLSIKLKVRRICSQFLRHNPMIVNPKWFEKEGIRVTKVVQKEGDLLIILPKAIHYGFNNGVNLAEAINFASVEQREYISRYVPRMRKLGRRL